jgi:anti-sigma regulatory factor (Ser/Thr protein kinase)
MTVPGAELVVEVRASPEAASCARRAIARLPALADDAALAADAGLLVSEVVTNVVMHAGLDATQDIEVHVALTSRRIRVGVRDSGAGFDPGQARHPPDASGGWGLLLVERLAERWGTRWRTDGFEVWFELPRSGAHAETRRGTDPVGAR